MWTIGLPVLSLSVLMLIYGRADADGVSQPFLKNDFVASMYAISMIAIAALGVGILFGA